MTSPQTTAQPRYRPLPFGVTRARVDRQPDGSMYLQAEQPLQAYGKRMSDYLLHWAEETPDATFLAQRQRLADGSLGDWQHLSYAQALTAARSIGQALLDRNLHAERPVLILSDNSLPFCKSVSSASTASRLGVPRSATALAAPWCSSPARRAGASRCPPKRKTCAR